MLMDTIGIRDPEKLKELLTAVLLIESDLSLPVVLKRVVKAGCTLADARYGALGVLDASGESLAEFITEGLTEAQIDEIGPAPTGKGLLGKLINDAKPLRVSDIGQYEGSAGFPPNHPSMSSFLGVPITVAGVVFGNIYLTEKLSEAEFTDDDEQVVIALASAAGIAIENARLHARVRELTLTEDRSRIARDLHDEVIQRIFAVGLSMQSMVRQIDSDQLRGRMQDAIDELDETIKQIRTTIFALSMASNGQRSSARAKILAVISDATASLGFEPHATFSGPIDAIVEEPVLSNLLAVLREALSNVARHADASVVRATISAGERLVLVVEDNGNGLEPGSTLGLGILNMRERGRQLGGELTFSTPETGGTKLTWTAEL